MSSVAVAELAWLRQMHMFAVLELTIIHTNNTEVRSRPHNYAHLPSPFAEHSSPTSLWRSSQYEYRCHTSLPSLNASPQDKM
ncbi:hypothetical protein SNOG_06905 [Parastagonospora nodorum SN15]|uniref:Uncharacterized protein n=1 Tax=Phaeosphaeria nodorum (strain SN15 / ATCC MYA-4574 / FGSC 10173) TaxID=321614 RepID=Q0UMV9_PHANO|nr:hypothetical protein SNOG_06905 [Parastagonospora nodorum SN15]EAT85556.1 hypothetical protein SNOG_06905 [Parastagonospora nodorum SN15]